MGFVVRGPKGRWIHSSSKILTKVLLTANDFLKLDTKVGCEINFASLIPRHNISRSEPNSKRWNLAKHFVYMNFKGIVRRWSLGFVARLSPNEHIRCCKLCAISKAGATSLSEISSAEINFCVVVMYFTPLQIDFWGENLNFLHGIRASLPACEVSTSTN